MLPIRVAALLLTGAVLAPLAAAGVRAAVALSGAPALADFAIAEALLSPWGLVLALLGAGLLIGVATLETTAMMAADLAARRGAPVGARAALAFALFRLPRLALFSALLAGAAC